MSDEHDSWFKNAFGVDLGEAANTIKEDVSAAAGAVASKAAEVVQDVGGLAASGAAGVADAATGVVGAVAKAAAGVAGAAAGVAKKAVAAASGGGTSDGGDAGGGGSFPLRGSVGRGGKNDANDVRAVQGALGIAADGQCGPQTVTAIEAFQRKTGMAKPDGRVDAGGATERALAGGGAKQASDEPAASSASSGLPVSLTEKIEGVSAEETDVAVAADLSGAGAEAAASPDDPIAERIIQILNAGGDLGQTIAGLRNQDMRRILDVMTHLRRAGKLQEFSQAVPNSGHERIVVAIRTILPNFDEIWRRILASLGQADRTAILERTPQVVRTEVDADLAAPSSKAGQDQEHGGSAEIGSDGLAVQGELQFHSALFGRPVPGRVTVELKPDGTLGKVDVDLKALKQKLSTTKLGPALDLQASLSLKASVVLGQKDTRTILEGVKGKIKAEVSATFTKIPVLKTLTLKLSAAVGKDGKFEVVPAIEIPLP